MILMLCVLGSTLVAKTQAPNLDTVKAKLFKVNSLFDSSAYLAFDVDFRYTTAAVYGVVQNDEMQGSYILNNRNIYYRVGNTEYAQNDSFAYNIYHDDKMFMMTRGTPATNTSMFPLREFVDSVIGWYASSYTITLGKDSVSEIIHFTTTVDSMPYKSFSIYYDSASYFPHRFEIVMLGSPELGDVPDSIAMLIRVKPGYQKIEKKITISFSNYHHPSSLDVFDNKQYVYYNRLNKRYEPA
jgi:hypothetical protein